MDFLCGKRKDKKREEGKRAKSKEVTLLSHVTIEDILVTSTVLYSKSSPTASQGIKNTLPS
jgi:hypothetical protein